MTREKGEPSPVVASSGRAGTGRIESDAMTGNRGPEPAERLPEPLLEEAAVWHARMQEPGGNAAYGAELGHWLQADPRHVRAYDEMARLWAAVEEPAALVAAQVPAAATRRRPVRLIAGGVAAIAACVLLVVAAGFEPAALLDHLRSDLSTDKGADTTATLADGTTVHLNTATAISVDFQAGRRRVRLHRGEAWFDVAGDPDRPFVVEADSARVQVTGTSFNVKIVGDAAVVSLASGRLTVSSAGHGGASVVLRSGEQARISGAGVEGPGRFDAVAVTAWRRHQFVFYDAPLEQVVAELNRYRSGRILLMGDDLPILRVSGVFDTRDPAAALRAIAGTLSVRMTRLTDYLVVLH